ncbi:MAG TPA: hypothetical protein VLY04_05170 [Bryobacteraceae bacterium]|nr:hypothetical protein [Bryobacteraceae bacterium]
MKTLLGVLTSILTVAVLVGTVLFVAVVSERMIPDLAPVRAAELVKAAPEFNRYAVLVQVRDIRHMKASMASVSYGDFSFRYLNSPRTHPQSQRRVIFDIGTAHGI